MALSFRRTPGSPRSRDVIRTDLAMTGQELVSLSLALIEFTVELYESLEYGGDHEEAEAIRTHLRARGISLFHGPEGVTWKQL